MPPIRSSPLDAAFFADAAAAADVFRFASLSPFIFVVDVAATHLMPCYAAASPLR